LQYYPEFYDFTPEHISSILWHNQTNFHYFQDDDYICLMRTCTVEKRMQTNAPFGDDC
jgi:hypothetical protein